MRYSGFWLFKLFEFPSLLLLFIHALLSDPTVGQLEPVVSLVPLGRYPFLSGSFNPAAPSTVQASSEENPVISRKLVDNFNPADTAYVEACKGYVGNAALGCPCGAPGKRCADPASICNGSYKCVCDLSLGYLDNTAKKCVRYSTTTTAVPLTCPACNYSCPTTTTASPITCPTVTAATTIPTTTTTAATTTPSPDIRCGNAYFIMTSTQVSSGGTDAPTFNCKFMVKGESYTYLNNGAAAIPASVAFIHRIISCPGVSNSFQVNVVSFSPAVLACDQAFVVIYDKSFCGNRITALIGTQFPIPASLFVSFLVM